MKYIKKVIIENFQSHKYTELDFDEHLNVIVGPSDQGKSAIIRGIKWALFNEPSGNFFIREGENDCSVTIVFNDDTKIKRYKSKSKNLYYFYDSKGEEHIFEGFGTSVPKEILEATNIRKIHLDGKQTSSMNISDQLEGPFLLSEKPATRANAVGRLVGVHIVDDAVGETLKDIRNLNISKRSLVKQLNRLETNLKEYDYLKDLDNTVRKLEDIKNKIKKLESIKKQLNDIRKKYLYIKKEIDDIQKIVNCLGDISKLDGIVNDLDVNVKLYNFIDNKQRKILDINKSICYNENIVSTYKEIYRVDKIIETLQNITKKKDRLEIINFKHKSIEKNIIISRNILNQLRNLHIVEEKISLICKYSKKLLELESIKKKNNENNMRITYGVKYLKKFSK